MTTTPIFCCQCGEQLAIMEQLPPTDLHIACPKCGLGHGIDNKPRTITDSNGVPVIDFGI